MSAAARAAHAYLAAVDAAPDLSGLTGHLLTAHYPEPPPLLLLPPIDPRTYVCGCGRVPIDRGPSRLPACDTHSTARLLLDRAPNGSRLLRDPDHHPTHERPDR